MSDAYRTSAYRCPVCKNSALREFHNRLVCDECQGMQLATDDFAASIHEIDGSSEPIRPSLSGEGGPCPQCNVLMKTCSLALGSLELGSDFMVCATHGLWVPRAAMTATYARASRRGGFKGLGSTSGAPSRFGGTGGGSDAGAVIANMPNAHGGMSGAMAGIANAFGAGRPASAGLAISGWQHHRPRAHTLFVSAHKDMPLQCPVCNVDLLYQGDRWSCGTCHGLFVETEALVAMVREMALTDWDMPAKSGEPGERACPICKMPLFVEKLEGATIDRCDIHGVWFDDHELEQALHHASAPPHGLGSWLKRLFKREPHADK